MNTLQERKQAIEQIMQQKVNALQQVENAKNQLMTEIVELRGTGTIFDLQPTFQANCNFSWGNATDNFFVCLGQSNNGAGFKVINSKIYSFFYDGSINTSYIQDILDSRYYTLRISISYSNPTYTLKYYIDDVLKQTRTFTYGSDSDYYFSFEDNSTVSGALNRLLTLRNVVYTRENASDGMA